jgi:F-type H+-transporting ATPase subunit c
MYGLGYGVAVLGIALGMGLIGYSALQGMARQPEAIGKLQTVMLIALAFVELTFFLTLFLGNGLVNVNPH